MAIPSGTPRWQRPKPGLIKLNWDAAIDFPGERMGVGVVARDHDGRVVGAMCCTRPFVSDPATAEAVGAWQAVLFGKQLGRDHIVFEGDSMEVVNVMRNETYSWTRYGMLVNAAKEELLAIPTWDFQHVRRGANMAAHCLAKHAFVQGEKRVWLGTSPSCIQDVLTVDNCLVS